MSENITFSVSGSETYYHKDYLNLNFKWTNGKNGKKLIFRVRSRSIVQYCREFGLYYERSDKGMPKFDYESYLWMEIFLIKKFGMRRKAYLPLLLRMISDKTERIPYKKKINATKRAIVGCFTFIHKWSHYYQKIMS